jgi:aspartate-semialdehyde dehydrogenase
MAESGYAVAIVGAAGEIGRDLREVLQERLFPVSSWHFYDEVEALVDLEDVAEAEMVRPGDEAGLSDVDLVFLCGSREQAEAVLEAVSQSTTVVIDLTQVLVGREDVALVVPEVNAAVIDESIGDGGRIATPLPAATALGVALAPLEEALRLRRVTVTCLEPVSTAPGGIQELVRQTGELLSGRDAEAQLWTARIAFNLIPQVGDIGSTGATEREWQVQHQLRSILDLPDLPVSAHVVRVPTFYGHGLFVTAETDEPVDAELARQLFRQAPGVLLHEGETDAATYPTMSDAVGSEATHVGRVREDPTVPCGVSFWLAIDGLRKGTTVNAVQIAECVVRGSRRDS